MFDVRGKAAIITGSARGFGKDMAHKMLQAGAKVCITDILEETGTETLAEFAKEFGEDKVLFVRCDVTKEEDWKMLWDKAESKLGYISVLVNNAGLHPKAGWKPCLEVMLWAQFLGTYLAMEKMGTTKGGRGGRVITTSSHAGMIAVGIDGLGWSGYCAAKFGNIAFTRMFRSGDQFEKEGVKGYALCPTLGETKMFEEEAKKAKNSAPRSNEFAVPRPLTVHDVGQSLMDALELDRNGACLLVYPDLPLMEVPNGTAYLSLVFIAVATLLKKMNIHIKVLRPKAFCAVIFLMMLALLYFVQFLLSFIF